MHVVIVSTLQAAHHARLHNHVEGINEQHLTMSLLQHGRMTSPVHWHDRSSLLALLSLRAACTITSFSGAAMPWQAPYYLKSRAAAPLRSLGLRMYCVSIQRTPREMGAVWICTGA